MKEKEKICYGALERSNAPITVQLRNAISAMYAIDDLTFRKTVSGSSVGQQFRHVLDVVDRLLEGVNAGRIDYSNRQRDTRVEKDRVFAISRFEETLERVLEISNVSQNTMVSVRSETDPTGWFISSVGREVDYVTSHSIHHYALIAEKLAYFGIEYVESFGVAPSTLEYRRGVAA